MKTAHVLRKALALSVLIAAAQLLDIAVRAQKQQAEGGSSREMSPGKRLEAETGPPVRNATSADDKPQLVTQLGTNVVLGVAFSPDGRYALTRSTGQYMAMGAAYGMAVLWEVETGREVRRFEGDSVTISRDGRCVMAVNLRNTKAQLWEIESGKLSQTTIEWGRVNTSKESSALESNIVQSVSLSRDGWYVLTGRGLGFDDHELAMAQLWDAKTGKELRRFERNYGEVESVAFSPDQRYALAAGRSRLGRAQASLWDIETAKEVQHFEGDFVALSPDGRYVLLTEKEGFTAHARLCDPITGKELRQFGVDTVSIAPTFSINGRYMVATHPSGGARLWDVETGMELRKLDGGFYMAAPMVYDFSISHDGKYILTGTDQPEAWMWDTATQKKVRKLEGLSRPVQSVALSSDGQYILTKGVNQGKSYENDQTVHLWDVRTGKEERRFEGKSVEVTRDGRYVFIGAGEDGKAARLIDVATEKEVQFKAGATEIFDSVSRDGRYLLTQGFFDRDVPPPPNTANEVKLWDMKTGGVLLRFSGHSAEISPDGRYVLIVSDGPAQLWDVKLRKVIRRIEGRSGIFWSDDVHLLIRDSSGVRLLNIETGSEVRRLNGAYPPITPDGRYAIAGADDHDQTAHLIDVVSGNELRRFGANTDVSQFLLSRHYENRVKDLVVSPDGRFLLAGFSDSTTRLWDAATGRELCKLISFRDGAWAVVDPEGRFDANSLEEIRGLHWLMPDDPLNPLPLEIFMRDYYEPRLLTRLLAGERLNPVKSLSELNRVQPEVRIGSVRAQQNNPNAVTVAVEVSKAKGEFQRGDRKVEQESGVYDLRLFRDGQLVGYAPENGGEVTVDPKRGNAVVTFSNLRLPRNAGANRVEFSAYAFNVDRVKSRTARKNFDIPKRRMPIKGRAYLVTVGVNAHENADFDLSFAANDARIIQRAIFDNLSRSGGYEQIVAINLISDYEMRNEKRVVTQKTATKESFRTVLNLLSGKEVDPNLIRKIPKAGGLRRAGPDDLVLISFSGHGVADEHGSFYFVPYDTGAGRGRVLTDDGLKRFISSDELSLWLRDVDAGEMVMIVDACHSAATVETESFKPGPMGSRGLGQLAYDKGMRIITSTQADDVALESDLIKQGLLTYALTQDGIEARQADFKPKNKRITLMEWLEYGVKRVPTLYEEVRKGELQDFGRGKDKRGLAVVSSRENNLATKKTAFQQPSLFDFSKRKQEVVLLKLN